jgi:hypothetical protein
MEPLEPGTPQTMTALQRMWQVGLELNEIGANSLIPMA